MAILLTLSAHSSSLFAGTTGKISGTVTNAETGEPLPGANVMIEGTAMGAATDANGFYFIINIPPGYYSVNAAMIGYTPISKTLVQVVTDMTSKVEFGLSPTVLEGEIVRVIAERPAIQKDLTSSLQAYASDEITGAPVENLSQLMEVQTGLSMVEPTDKASILRDSPGDGLHIRGGRENETAFLVDGVRVDNPIWGGATYSQNTSGSTVTEMMTILGTFNAEYGGKMSGVINLVTKEAPDKLSGKISGYSDNFGIDQFNRNTYQGEATLTGPAPIIKGLTFLLNAQTRTTDGRFRGYLIPGWTDSKGQVGLDSEGDPVSKDSVDWEEVSADWKDEWNTLAKIMWDVSPNLKMMGSYISSYVRQVRYYHDYKYLPYGMPWRETESSGFTGKITYQASPRTFAELALSSQRIGYWSGVHKTRGQRIVLGSRRSEPEYEFNYSGAKNNFWADTSTTNQLVFNVTSQVGKTHLFKAGVDARYMDLFHTMGNAWGDPVNLNIEVDSLGNLDTTLYLISKSYANSEPVELAAYFQDKMEFESIGMILNIGIRWERWDLGEKYMENPELPFETPLLKTKPKDRISPRLGISYPISDKAAFHFAYGHFYQMPSYIDLLSGINEEGEYPNRPNLSGVGLAIFNPNIEPERSVTYEAGVQTWLMSDVTLNVTAFYREMASLVGVTWVQVEGYVYYDNVDFGNSKGVEFNLNKRFSNYYSARVNYTLSQTLLSTSSPMTAAQTVSSAPIVYKSYHADWDRTHNLSAYLRFSDPGKWAVSFTSSVKSGKPYSVLAEQRNTERMPWYINVNMKMDKYLSVGGVRGNLYIQIFNLFDRKNIYSVYPITGKWDDDDDPGTPYIKDANPRRRSDGIRARVGIRIEF
jgi:hypothetical protein